MTLRTLSMVAVIAGVVFAPSIGFAAQKHHGGARSHAHATAHVRAGNRHVTARHSARPNVTTNRVRTRTVNRSRATRGNFARGNVRIGHRYHGGTWYGARRHYWHGRWYAYGVGSCWLPTPIGYVWVCGV